jgi:hypothetical protein
LDKQVIPGVEIKGTEQAKEKEREADFDGTVVMRVINNHQ